MGNTAGELPHRLHLLGLTQLLLNLQLLGTIDKTADHANGPFTIPHRQNTIRNRKGAAVPAPEQLIFNHPHHPGFTHPVSRTLLSRISGAIGPGMVHQVMHLLSQQLVRRIKAQHLCTGLIGQSTAAIMISAVDTFLG